MKSPFKKQSSNPNIYPLLTVPTVLLPIIQLNYKHNITVNQHLLIQKKPIVNILKKRDCS